MRLLLPKREREGQFWACVAYPLGPILKSDGDKPSPRLKTAGLDIYGWARDLCAERLSWSIPYSLSAGQ